MHCTRRCSPINRRRSASLKSTDSGCRSLWIPKVIPRAFETTSADEEIKDHVPAMIDAMAKMLDKNSRHAQCSFFSNSFSHWSSLFFVGAHGMVCLIKFHCLYSWSCFSHYVLTILVFVEFVSLITKLYLWYSYSVSWAIIQTREGWALAPTPWAKICSKKRVWTPVSMKQTNKCPNLIRLWHLPLPAMSFTEAVKLQLPLLLHHLLHIHGRVP